MKHIKQLDGLRGLAILLVLIHRLLKHRPATNLIHLPGRYVRIEDVLSAVLTIILSLAVAYASYHVFEKHFLRLKSRFEINGHTQQTLEICTRE